MEEVIDDHQPDQISEGNGIITSDDSEMEEVIDDHQPDQISEGNDPMNNTEINKVEEQICDDSVSGQIKSNEDGLRLNNDDVECDELLMPNVYREDKQWLEIEKKEHNYIMEQSNNNFYF